MPDTQAVFNIPALTKEHGDSGAIGVMESVIHAFADAGEYRIDAYDGDDSTGVEFRLFVADEHGDIQVDVDLSTHCDDPMVTPCQTIDLKLKTGGFALFHATEVSKGFRVEVFKYIESPPDDTGHRPADHYWQKVFDTRELKNQDIYVITFVYPDVYLVNNVLLPGGEPHGVLEVRQPADPLPVDPVEVLVSLAGLAPREFRTVSTQPVAFGIQGDDAFTARITLAPYKRRPQPFEGTDAYRSVDEQAILDALLKEAPPLVIDLVSGRQTQETKRE